MKEEREMNEDANYVGIELPLKNARLNMKEESGNIKPGWDLLGYLFEGNFFWMKYQRNTNMSLRSYNS